MISPDRLAHRSAAGRWCPRPAPTHPAVIDHSDLRTANVAPTAAASPRSADASRRSLLQRQAYQAVKQLIVSGEAPPGAFLSQRQLARRLGMSKTPVHVALERLQAEGFIEIAPQQGIVVRAMSVEDIVEHFELRQALESFVVARLAGKLRPEQVEQLHHALAEQQRAVQAGDVQRFVELDAQFHLLLCRFLANRQISLIM